MLTLILFLLVLFAANTVQMVTGFAGNLIAMPFAILLIGYDSSRVSINLFTLLACFLLSYQNKEFIRLRILFPHLICMLAGMLLAFGIQPFLPLQLLRYAYGGFLLLAAIYLLLYQKRVSIGKKTSGILAIAAGVMHTLFLSGGALLTLLLSQKLENREEFRATISTAWVLLGIFLIIRHVFEGLYTAENAIYILWSIPVCLLTIPTGKLLYKKINSDSFQMLIYGLLLISGFSMFLS